VVADDELDSLYMAPPDAFTAERTRLTAAAKQRGDAAAAKRISAARKPTTAAWLVNRLVLRRQDTRQRLADLGDRLREAHAAMDGDRVRELSAEQHRLVVELARAALEDADVKNPSSALRDDLTGTLQAAIADPEVAARLGRLEKAERWSGFGALGDAAPVSTATRAGRTKPEPPRGKEAEAARERLEKSNAAVSAAERAKAAADEEMAARRTDLVGARQRRDEALASLRAAERALNSAQDRYDKAKRACRAASKNLESVKEARKRLGRS
jgi:hypothetical protein